MLRHSFSPSNAAARAPLAHPLQTDAPVAANDEIETDPEFSATPPNPLWVITIGMAVFFVMTGLLMIFS